MVTSRQSFVSVLHHRRIFPLLRGVPYEQVAGVIQDISSPATDRHRRGQNGRIESARGQSREEPTVNRDRALMREVATEVDRRGRDSGLRTPLLVLGAGGRRRKGHKGLRTKRETGKSVTIH